MIMPNTEYTDTVGIGGAPGFTYTASRKSFVLPHGYLGYNKDELPVAFSLAINTPFGLSTDWRNSGAPFSTTALALKVPALAAATATYTRIQMINFNPSMAVRVNDVFAFALGVDHYRVMNANMDNPFMRFSGSGGGWGYNFSVLYRSGNVGIGASYRSQVKTKLTGTAVYPLGQPPLLPAGFSTSGSTTIKFPDMFNFGVSYRIDPRLLLSLDIDWVNWATYKTLLIEQPALGAAGTLPVVNNWNDIVDFRVGAEWSFDAATRLRLGYVYDPTPIDPAYFTPRIPGNRRQLFNIGLGYDFDKATTLDVAYSYVAIAERSQTASKAVFYNGKYKSNAHILAASVTHRF
ncbi:MAG: hypothetical protein D6678_07615 [Zetaproteobacteria bacterium]|nr:MAG: hypothetical protein D6678_07615 [Zetaproteobacteria bacterium]